MPAVLKSSFSKCGIGTLSLVHPFQATKSGPDPGYVSSALRSRRKGQRYVFQPGGIWKTSARTQENEWHHTGDSCGKDWGGQAAYQPNGARRSSMLYRYPFGIVFGSLRQHRFPVDREKSGERDHQNTTAFGHLTAVTHCPKYLITV